MKSSSKITSKRPSSLPDKKKKVKLSRVTNKFEGDLTCCCSLNVSDYDVLCAPQWNLLKDLSSSVIVHLNDVKGFIPVENGLNYGVLYFYLRDCITWYAHLIGVLPYVPDFNAGSLVLPTNVAAFITESVAHVKNPVPGTLNTFKRRINTTANDLVLETITAGSSRAPVNTGVLSANGEPVFGLGSTFGVVSARTYYTDVVRKLIGYSETVTVESLNTFTCSHDFFHNSCSLSPILPAFVGVQFLDPTIRLTGSPAAPTVFPDYPSGSTRLLMLGAYLYLAYKCKYKPNVSIRKILAKLGYSPMEFRVYPQEQSMSKFRGLAFSLIGYHTSSWTAAEQSLALAELCCLSSYWFCRMPSFAHVGSYLYKSKVWDDYPTYACVAEIGTLPRRVNNSMLVPYINNDSGSFPHTPFMSLIQPSAITLSSFDEKYDAFPIDFSWAAGLSIGNLPIVPGSVTMNIVPVFQYSELVSESTTARAFTSTPMPTKREIIPATITYSDGGNTVATGGPVIHLPAPSEVTCFTLCDYKQCATAPALLLSIFNGVGVYVMPSLDSSCEVYSPVVRASIINNATVVSAGATRNDPQKSITNMFYNSLLTKPSFKEVAVSYNQLIEMANSFNSEGNAVPVVSTDSLYQVLTNPTPLNVLVATAAGAMAAFPRVRDYIRTFNPIALIPA